MEYTELAILFKVFLSLATGLLFGYWQRSYLAGCFMFLFTLSIS